IANNTISNTGRFGIEIKIPNGTGAASGDGSIVVNGNTLTAGANAANLDDRAGIAVIRRGYCNTCGETDITTGVIVSGNTVSGWQPSTGSSNQGFGIVVEGTNSQVSGNTLSGNQIGVQFQAGNAGYPSDSNQNASDAFFSRGDAPNTCALLGSNTDSSNGTDFLAVTNPPGMPIQALVHNTTRGTFYCTIQSAINDAITQNGDTIAVDPGSFAENVSVTKGVILQGPKAGIAGYDASRDGTGEAVLSPTTPTTNNASVVLIAANNVTFDGFTIQNVNNIAIASGGNYGGSGNNAQIVNNRILDIQAGSGLYTNGPYPAVAGWTIARNLVRNVVSNIGSGINYWAANGGVITANHVEQSGFGGIQAVNSSNVQITGNTISNTAHSGINIGTISGSADGNVVSGNTLSNANTSGNSVEGGLTLSSGVTNVTFTCNAVSGSGTNGFATGTASSATPGAHVFDNAITVASDISNNQSAAIAIGSNWYGGSAATVGGSNAAGAQVAAPLSANPIGNPACGDNTPTQIVVVSGSGQHALITSAFGSPLVARVQDALGGAVIGEPVTFTPPASGASANLATPVGTSNYNGMFSTTAIANSMAGSYNVLFADTNYAGIAPASFTLYNERAPATITLNASDLNVTYDGNPHAVSATTSPAGLNYSVTYNGSLTAPSAVGSYNVVATITDPSYSGSTSGTLTITAASAPDLGVTINDGRQYVQYGKTLTYTITVNNVGNTVIGSGTVSDTLPPELDASTATAQCFVAGVATCTAPINTATGVLSGTVSNIPIGGGATFVITATVSTAPNLASDQVVNQVTVGTSGDSNSANDTATSTTQIVIYRDGFESGGDGAQAAIAGMHGIGTLNDASMFAFDPAQAPQSGNALATWTRATDARGREVFRIESLRVAGNVLVQLVSSDASGHEAHTAWMPLGKQTAGLALAETKTTRAVILVGADNGGLQAAIPSWATLPLTIYTAQ
ncbi:MAG TPA: MBG domain-containing protein, partial [Rudaea sp.]